MDKFFAMQAFVRVVEAGTFTKAADLLDVPKTTVTRLIQTLEQHLQTKLLNRTTRRVTVTVDGAAYYDRVVRLLGEVDELESSMSRAKANPRGRLRVEVPSPVAKLLLIPALPDFHARYPDIQLELGVSDRPVDLLSENVDCVLRGGDLIDQSLVARRLGEFHSIVCASPGYLQQHGRPTHPLDLEQPQHMVVNYLSHRTGRAIPFNFWKNGERLEVKGRCVLSVNDSIANLIAGLAGMGVIRTASFLAQTHIGRGELEPVLADWCAESIPIHVVYPPNRHLSTKVRVFVDWVVELFERSDLVQRKSSLPHYCSEAAISVGAMAEAAAEIISSAGGSPVAANDLDAVEAPAAG